MKKVVITLIGMSLIILIGYVGLKLYKPEQVVKAYQLQPKIEHQAQKEMKEELVIESKERMMSDEIDRHGVGEAVANLMIPKIEQQYTTYWGTDDDTLDQGVGLYVSEWTVTPDFDGHVVMSGHRDTVFSELGMLDVKDVIEVEYEGKTYEYEIDNTWITHADDRTVIVDKDEPTLTLTTCYPFDYIGAAPDRYIIQATLRD